MHFAFAVGKVRRSFLFHSVLVLHFHGFHRPYNVTCSFCCVLLIPGLVHSTPIPSAGIIMASSSNRSVFSSSFSSASSFWRASLDSGIDGGSERSTSSTNGAHNTKAPSSDYGGSVSSRSTVPSWDLQTCEKSEDSVFFS